MTPSTLNMGPSRPLIDRFAALWSRAGDPPDLSAFLAAHPDAASSDRLELVLLDQHQRFQAGCPRQVEAYLVDFPELARSPERMLDLVYGEFRSRLQRGESPNPESFLARFPDLGDELRKQLELGCWLNRVPLEASPRAGGPEPAETDTPLDPHDFLLGDRLGSGGMGTVYRASWISAQRPVAVKVLKHVAGAPPQAVARFLAEGRALARLAHPHIVGVHGLGRTPDGSYFLVMDLVTGINLAERLQQGPLSVEEAIALVIPVAEAIEHAHQHHLIHRDLKPSNILLDRDGHVWVTDFGLVKHLDSDEPSLTAPDQLIGTPHYMAPEMADDQWGRVGPRTDVYGLGALLYALLSGGPPFAGSSSLELVTRVASSEPPRPLREVAPHVPEPVETICQVCLSKDPRARYGSARQVADALRLWPHVPPPVPTLAGEPEPGPAPTGGVRRFWKRRTGSAIAAGAIAAFLILTALAAMTWGWLIGGRWSG